MAWRLAFAALVGVLAPPALAALGGGVELDVPGLRRLSWFQTEAFTLALALAAAGVFLDARGRRLARLLLAAAAAILAFLAAYLWIGRFDLGWVRLDGPWRPGLEAAAALALAVAAGARPAPARRRAAAWALGGLVAGAALLQGAAALDRRELAQRLSPPLPPRSGRDVVFVLVDTLRADALGAYGAAPSPSPWLDASAARSRLFARAVAQAPWTFPSLASLITARHPSRLPVQARRDDALPAFPAEVPCLAEWLRAHGWRTAGFYANPVVGTGSGFERGFDVYESARHPDVHAPSARLMVDAALRFGRVLAERRAAGDRQPFFLYLHFMDPHLDYRPPRRFRPAETRRYRGPLDGSAAGLDARVRAGAPISSEDRAFLRALYQGEVAHVDTEMSRLEAGLRARGVWSDDTVFVFTSDHGEQFGEHGEFAHQDVHAENVHVPLWIQARGLGPGRSDEVVRLLDLAPTLLDLLGLPPLPHAEGRSLASLERREAPAPAAPPAFTEHGARQRVTTPEWSLVVDGDREELFAWPADPGERVELAGAHPVEARALRALLDAHLAGVGGGGEVPRDREIDPATRAALEALGYL